MRIFEVLTPLRGTPEGDKPAGAFVPEELIFDDIDALLACVAIREIDVATAAGRSEGDEGEQLEQFDASAPPAGETIQAGQDGVRGVDSGGPAVSEPTPQIPAAKSRRRPKVTDA
ncbi:MAG: hypothetical protein AB7E60_01935 [Sphingobium sp.]